MRQSRFTEAQIIGMIKEHEAGMPTAEVCRRHGPSPASFYKFKAKRDLVRHWSEDNGRVRHEHF
jgi:putative transposase